MVMCNQNLYTCVIETIVHATIGNMHVSKTFMHMWINGNWLIMSIHDSDQNIL
jgi:hypothetical protein